MDKTLSWILKIGGLLGAVLILVLIIDVGSAIRSKYTAVDSSHVVTISAQGKITAAPDLLEIGASVLTNAENAQSAQALNTDKMNKVLAFVKSQGVDPKDIQTSSYNIYPTYNYKTGTQTIIGYSASQTITIKVHDLKISGPLLDGLVQNGANQIDNVNYTFSDPEGLREQAREQALASAHDKALKLAAAAGASLGTLVTFTEGQNNYPRPIPYMLSAPNAAGGLGGGVALPPVQTEPGTQDITADVTVTYSLK